MYSAELKIPDGKLIRIKFSMKDNKIEDIKITGDFFLHPEDGLEELERKLRGVEIEFDALQNTIHDFFNKEFFLIGAKPEDIIRTILLAKK